MRSLDFRFKVAYWERKARRVRRDTVGERFARVTAAWRGVSRSLDDLKDEDDLQVGGCVLETDGVRCEEDRVG